MNGIAQILEPGSVRPRLPGGSKKMLFQRLAGLAAGVVSAEAGEVLERLNEREQAGGTGYGGGAAVPHGRLASLTGVHGFFARLSEPVDYGAVDGVPVDLVFMLLSPEGSGAAHLKALAAVSRLLRDETMTSKLRGARSRDALYALLTGDEARNAG